MIIFTLKDRKVRSYWNGHEWLFYIVSRGFLYPLAMPTSINSTGKNHVVFQCGASRKTWPSDQHIYSTLGQCRPKNQYLYVFLRYHPPVIKCGLKFLHLVQWFSQRTKPQFIALFSYVPWFSSGFPRMFPFSLTSVARFWGFPSHLHGHGQRCFCWVVKLEGGAHKTWPDWCVFLMYFWWFDGTHIYIYMNVMYVCM